MKVLRLKKGFTTVDSEDYPVLARFTWHAGPDGYIRNGYLGLLHRFLLGYPKGFSVDHINGDMKDNQKKNLRKCPHRQNLQNQHRKTGLKGIHARLTLSKGWAYRVTIKYRGRKRGLGTRHDLYEAAALYNQAAKKYFGEFARLNDLTKIRKGNNGKSSSDSRAARFLGQRLQGPTSKVRGNGSSASGRK